MQSRSDYIQASFLSFLIHAILFLYLVGFFYTEKQIRPILSKAVNVSIIVNEVQQNKITSEIPNPSKKTESVKINDSNNIKVESLQINEQGSISNLQNLIKQETDLTKIDQLESDIARFSSIMIKLIEDAWIKPKNIQEGLVCDIKIKTNAQGRVINIILTKSSGNIRFDNSALQAVKRVETFSFYREISRDIYEDYFKNITISFNPTS